MSAVRTLRDVGLEKVAIEICHHPDLKYEIFCVPDSYFCKRKKTTFPRSDAKNIWNEIIAEKAAIIIEKLSLPEELQTEVIRICLPIGMRMLVWAKFHERNFNLPYLYLVDFSNYLLFSAHGIDYKKAGKLLLNDENLSIKQRYMLACYYCCKKDILSLYKQMSKEEKTEFCYFQYPETICQLKLLKYWSYYAKYKLYKFEESRSRLYDALEHSIHDGSRVAVEYFWKKLSAKVRKEVVVAIGMKTLRTISVRYDRKFDLFNDSSTQEIFNKTSIDLKDRLPGTETWIPKQHLVDILVFILLEMENDQKVQFLRNDVKHAGYSRILDFFFDWPYQNYFMKTVKLMWEFLPDDNYAYLLMEICQRFQCNIKRLSLENGQEECCDYGELFKEYWCQSPARYKRYCFRGKECTNDGIKLLMQLYLKPNFTNGEKEIANLILECATDEERENIICSRDGKYICATLAGREKWGLLEEFVKICLSEEKIKRWKKNWSFSEAGMFAYRIFALSEKYDASESFIKPMSEFLKWSSLVEEEIIELKEKISASQRFIEAGLLQLALDQERLEVAEIIVKWCLSSGEKVDEFKRKLISRDVIFEYLSLKPEFKLDCVEKFLNWCGLTSEEGRSFKKKMAYKIGKTVCKNFICNQCWEDVEMFLTLCFTSEEEISEYKKDLFLGKSGRHIHYKLIKHNKWTEAETFFKWLGLSAGEITKMKKRTLLDCKKARKMFDNLVFSDGKNQKFANYGNKMEAIELFLRWYLTDKETVVEFKNCFQWRFRNLTGKWNAKLNDFDLAIEEHLKHLDRELDSLKGKDGGSSSSERDKFNKIVMHYTL